MKFIRKGIALALVMAMCATSAFSVAASAQLPAGSEPAAAVSASASASVPDTLPPEESRPADSVPAPDTDSKPAESAAAPSADSAADESVPPDSGSVPSEEALPGSESEQTQPKEKQEKKNISLEKQQSTTITAEVAAAASSYSVTIPEGLDLGTLAPGKDFVRDYQISVSMPDADGVERVTVSAPEHLSLWLNGNEQDRPELPGANRFGTQYFRQDGVGDGRVTITKEDIAAARPGHYVGNLIFTITYESNPGDDPAPPADTAVRYTSDLSIRHYDHPEKPSMSNNMFFHTAEIVQKGEMAELTMYIVDPVPGFEADGTPVRDLALHFDGVDYPCQVLSDQKITKHFEVDGGLFASGDYAASPVKVELPMEAVRAAAEAGHLKGTAYVSTVMKQNVEFWVVLAGLTPVDPEQPGPDQPVDPETTQETVTLSLRRADAGHSGEASRVNQLFHQSAYLTYKGDEVTVTMYVMDPVPHFTKPQDRSPVENMVLYYGGAEYPAAVDRAKTENKYFEAAPEYNITAGVYPASPVTVTLPRAAVKDSAAFKLRAKARINTVADAVAEFLVVLDGAPIVPPTPDKPAPTPDKPGPTPEKPGPNPDKPYDFQATVHMHQENKLGQLSMCDPLFHRKADVKQRGDMADVTLYVIDPVPAFASEGTPVKNVKLSRNGKTYDAAVHSGEKVNKYFDERAGFIPKSGEYPATPVTFTVPMEALQKSADGSLMCDAYVSAVMHTDVTFHMVFTDVPGGDIAPLPTPTPTPTPTPLPKPTPSQKPAPSTKPVTPPQDGQMHATVHMHKKGSMGTLSMCDPLFHRVADIQQNGDQANVTLYVIDPVPQFASEGTPVRNVKLNWNGGSTSASVGGGKTDKYFDARDGFIPSSGSYPATPITFTVPMSAIQSSGDGSLVCSAYVNAVMHTDVEFHMVFTDIAGGAGTVTPGVSGPGFSSGTTPGGSSGTLFSSSGSAKNGITLEMDEGTPTYYTSPVDMHKADKFSEKSMCDPLFFANADFIFQGDTVQVTLYVIDPVPKFAAEGTPLSNLYFTYDGKTYNAVVEKDKVNRHYDKAPGFIEEAGDYPATPVRVVLPKEAIEASRSGKLGAGAYVNTVMHTDVEFKVVFGELEETDGPPADQPVTDSVTTPGGKQDGTGSAVSAQSVSRGPVRLVTGLFPQALVWLLVTAAILGACCAVWMRRR